MDRESERGELVPLLICAGKPEEALAQAIAMGIDTPAGNWSYVLNPHEALAYHGALYIVIGTFWHRQDALNILHNLEMRECVEMPVEETR